MSKISITAIEAIKNGVVKVLQKEIPSDPGKNELLVKTSHSIISPGTERAWITGKHLKPRKFPFNPGYISEGEVISVGDGIETIMPGDKVVYPWHVSHRIVGLNWVIKINSQYEDGKACIARLLAIPSRGIRNASPSFGESIIVFGLGPIGLGAVLFARLNGGYPVIGIDPDSRRRDLGIKNGCDFVFNPDESDFEQQIIGTVGRKPEIIVDATGNSNVIPKLFSLTAEYGRIIVLGGIHEKVSLDLYTDFQKRSITLIGSGDNKPKEYPFTSKEEEVNLLVKMIEAGRVSLKDVIEDISIDDVNKIYSDMLSGSLEKPVFRLNW